MPAVGSGLNLVNDQFNVLAAGFDTLDGAEQIAAGGLCLAGFCDACFDTDGVKIRYFLTAG